MQNPYRQVLTKSGEPALPGIFRLKGQGTPFTDKKGEINATSVQDLLSQIGGLIQEFNSGNLSVARGQYSPEVLAERRKILAEAMADRSGQMLQVLGEALVAEIQDTTNREGFARRILQYRELGAGENDEVRIREHNVIAWLAVSASEVRPIIVRDRRIRPPEFNNESYILVDLKELSYSTADLLEEKYEEGLAAIMVNEDRMWKRLADNAATVRNTIQYFTTFTPLVFSRVRNQVARWGIPTPTCLMSYDLWDDFIGNNEWSGTGLFDPVTKWELIQEGYLGSVLGCALITDSFRQPNLRVLDLGTLYIVGAPINHGVITLRGQMLVEPINTFNQGKSYKGWFINEILSMVIGNSAAIGKGARL
jgi:hypothetical protein